MIKSITVTNPRDESLEMVLTDPEKSGFVITEITGLNPPKAEINSTELVTGNGAVFNSSRMTSRNIVITMKYLRSPSIEQCREKSYRYFPISHKIRLTIKTDLRSCYIDGYVESNEAVIFSSQAYTQISIICPQPALLDVMKDTNIFSGIEPVFEFPIENNGVEFVIDDPLEFSLHLDRDVLNVVYTGEIDNGCRIFLNFLDPVKNIRIWNYYKHGTTGGMYIDTDKVAKIIGSPIDTGDEILINTIDGEKKIVCIHDGIEYNILNCINKKADWIQLTMGNNTICYSVEEGRHNMHMRIENDILLQGV